MSRKKYGISEVAFKIIDASESIEGFKYDESTITAKNENTFKNITKELVVDFLECPDTKVYAVKSNSGNYELVAHNSVSNEAIKILGMGDHFVALVNTVIEAQKRVADPTLPKITHKFIKSVNEQILLYRSGEAAIGSYRYEDFWGRPLNVSISAIIHGRLVRQSCFNTENSEDKNVFKKMDELVSWVNNEAFKDEDTIMNDIARFHSSFIRIHPFRDGNGRTARLLTNYLLLINGYPLVNISSKNRDQYLYGINYAEAPTDADFCKDEEYKRVYELFTKKYGKRDDITKYLPLADCFKQNTLDSSNAIIEDIINYKDKPVNIQSTQL